jgi:hypothetical protein
MSGPFVDSLRHRVRAMNTLYQRAVQDMTLEQINHQERSGILPISFSLSHFMRAQDQAMSGPFLQQPTIWQTGAWAAKTGATVDKFGLGEEVNEMEQLRFQDIGAWRLYQTKVIEQTVGILASANEALLLETVLPKLPPALESSYCAIVIGHDAPLRKLEVVECFIYQHGLRHMGEIEYARSFVGLGGLTA